MRAGRNRHRVLFLEPIASTDTSGSEVVAFTPAFRHWAYVEPIRAAEALRSNQPLEVVDTRIGGRWSRGIARVSTKWRALHAGVLYDLVSVVDVKSAGVEFEMLAKSGAIS